MPGAFVDAGLADFRHAVHVMLDGLDPCPALAVDRHWNIIERNRVARALATTISKKLLGPEANVLRMSLHPEGLAKQIVNLKEWRAFVLRRLARDIDMTRDPVLVDLLLELTSYGAPFEDSKDTPAAASAPLPIAVPMRLRTAYGELSFWTTTTIFGSALDTTVSEIAIESFLPANAETRRSLDAIAAALPDIGLACLRASSA